MTLERMTADASTDERPTVLVIDDDEIFRVRLVRAFADRGYDAKGAADYDMAMALARTESPEYAVIDLRLGGRSGLELVKGLRALDPTTVLVILTGYGSIATAVESLRLGAVHYLSKPVDVDQIIAAFEGVTAGSQQDQSDVAVPSLARVEWEHIQRVLTDCGGNISQAARLLGLHRRSLQRKLGKLPARR